MATRSPHAASPWPALGAGLRPSPFTDTIHSSERSLSPKLLHHPDGITAVDTEYLHPGHAASHIIQDAGHAAFVDVGTNYSVPHLLAALETLGIAREAVDYVFLTHVHLDHAGGAGRLMQELPRDPSDELGAARHEEVEPHRVFVREPACQDVLLSVEVIQLALNAANTGLCLCEGNDDLLQLIRLRPILRVWTVRRIRLRRIRLRWVWTVRRIRKSEPQPEPQSQPKCQWGRWRIPERGRRPVQVGGRADRGVVAAGAVLH